MDARGARRRLAEVPRTAADLAFADLEAIPDSGMAEDYHRARLDELRRNAQWITGINVLAAGLFLWLGWASLPDEMLIGWCAALAAVALAVLLAGHGRFGSGRQPSIREAHARISIGALLIGGTWAVCPLLFLKGAPFDIQLTIVFMSMGAAGLGAMVLARLPSAAILYSCLVTAALTASLFHLPARSAAVVAVLAAAFGATLAAVLVQAHRKELQHARQAADSSRQAEIIALLLREFEAGASDWIWETGPDGRLTYVSDRMAQALKRQRDRLLGATLMQAAGRARRSGSWRQVAATMAGRHVLCETLVPVTVARKTMWWQLTARPLHAADGTFRGYRGVGKDVTVRHQSEINVLKAKEAAERESQSKSQFLAMMSHELRTPLNAIVGFSQILAEEKEGPHASRNYAEYAKAIHQSSGHLASLINDILDITRFERGGITLVEQELDLVELVELSVRMCRTTAAENRIELVERHAFTRLEVRGDLTRLRQIVLNLLVNAIKFSPSGGVVTAGVEPLPDGRVAVAVSDNGIGIEPSKLQHIFEPFAQADSGFARRFGGLGLGLAIARRMARLHGGDILIASAPGKGTLARLVLPASRVVEEKPRQAKAQKAA